MSIVKHAMDSFVANSNDVLELKLIRTASDLEDEKCVFKPDMTHQVFGDRETIFGYRDLKIKLYYSAAKLTTYLDITYSDKIDPRKYDGCEADDIYKKIVEVLQPGFVTNLDVFCNALPKDADFVPFGELLHSFPVIGDDSSKRTFEIYCCDVTTPGFTAYHERLQTFVMWYIDAGSFIAVDDEGWKFFFLFEKYTSGESTMYAIAGYATIFEYYAYPINIRPRISQMLVLPPFQRLGLGTELLTCVYQYYVSNPKVIDITVEDPSENFQRLRDFVDSKNCSTLGSFQPNKLEKGFDKEMFNEARSKLKLSKNQTRRVYEILRLKNTNTSDKEKYRSYRLNVKQRLNLPYQKQQNALNKLKKLLSPEEFQESLGLQTGVEQRLETLERDYRELEEEYRHIIERLSVL